MSAIWSDCRGRCFQTNWTYSMPWCGRWNHFSEPGIFFSKKLNVSLLLVWQIIFCSVDFLSGAGEIKSRSTSHLSVIISDGLYCLNVFLSQLYPVLLTHGHVLGDGDRSISASVRLVKQLTQSWNDNDSAGLVNIKIVGKIEWQKYLTKLSRLWR